MSDDLAPVLEALGARADTAATRAEEEAADRARGLLETAAAEARRREEGARAEGRRIADEEMDRELLQARRRANEAVQAARRRALDDLRAACVDAASALRASDRYPALEDRLAREAREVLGDDCDLVRDPDDRGGVVATAGTRRLDLTLPALVDVVLADLGADVEELWR